jgi:SulP family sulfate permease
VAEDVDEFAAPNREAIAREAMPHGLEIFQLSGPFFFAAATEFEEILMRSGGAPKVLILRMAAVTLIDVSGARALQRFIGAAGGKGTAIVLCELRAQTAASLRSLDIAVPKAETLAQALAIGRALLPHP